VIVPARREIDRKTCARDKSCQCDCLHEIGALFQIKKDHTCSVALGFGVRLVNWASWGAEYELMVTYMQSSREASICGPRDPPSTVLYSLTHDDIGELGDIGLPGQDEIVKCFESTRNKKRVADRDSRKWERNV
jgi:hypothetical protein